MADHKITLNLDDAQYAALSWAAEQNESGLTPEEYLAARMGDVVGSYAQQLTDDDVSKRAEAIRRATPAEKSAVDSALSAKLAEIEAEREAAKSRAVADEEVAAEPAVK